jgi:hypothetical protein
VKRPAWLFSARASVSNHSAISSKPSSRAVGEARVHLGVLVGLAGDRGLEVVLGVADRLARRRVAHLGQVLEVAVRVPGLALGDRAEQGRHVGVALDVGLLGEPQVATVGLALAGERLLQVLVGLGAVEVGHGGAPGSRGVWCWCVSVVVLLMDGRVTHSAQ